MSTNQIFLLNFTTSNQSTSRIKSDIRLLSCQRTHYRNLERQKRFKLSSFLGINTELLLLCDYDVIYFLLLGSDTRLQSLRQRRSKMDSVTCSWTCSRSTRPRNRSRDNQDQPRNVQLYTMNCYMNMRTVQLSAIIHQM